MSKRLRVVTVAFLMAVASIVFVQNGLPLFSSVTASESSAVSAQDQLHQKFVERKKLLDQTVEEIKLSMQFGRGSLVAYRQAKEAALRAGLALCQTKEERINIFDEILTFYTESEKLLEFEIKAGQRGRPDLREAKLARLEVEIERLKEHLE